MPLEHDFQIGGETKHTREKKQRGGKGTLPSKGLLYEYFMSDLAACGFSLHSPIFLFVCYKNNLGRVSKGRTDLRAHG